MDIGTIISYASETVPDGFLECDGSSLLRADYAKLFTAIGTVWGTADATHFNIPDLRGKFPRGWAHGTANDPDRDSRSANATGGETGDKVGSVQSHMYQSHGHTSSYQIGRIDAALGSTFPHFIVSTQYTSNQSPAYGSETRPININFMFIIRYE